MALALGCGSSKPAPEPTHQKVCGDEAGRTVDWTKCEEEEQRRAQSQRRGGHFVPLYFWYYGPFSGRTPAVGTPLSGFSRVPPTGSGVRIASPTRGGFGSSARPSSGA
jgi:hypothetical protein